MQHHMRHDMHKQGKKDASIIGILTTDSVTMEQLMVSSQGPMFLWSINSVRQDTYVRNNLAKHWSDRNKTLAYA